MDTLTYGRKRPEDGDRGSAFWDALHDNVTLDDAHDHDGTDSAQIPSKNITRGTTSVTNTGWSVSGTRFRKTVTVASGYSLVSCQPIFILSGGGLTGNRIYPDYEYINTTSFYLYMPVDDQAVTVLFV